MRNVLADLALESEAATQMMMALAHAFEHADDDPLAAAWKRVVTPAAKFWICKRALEATGEAMEVWGGNGYVEEGPMARLYREAPVNSIWEGSGNARCAWTCCARCNAIREDGARVLQDLARLSTAMRRCARTGLAAGRAARACRSTGGERAPLRAGAGVDRAGGADDRPTGTRNRPSCSSPAGSGGSTGACSAPWMPISSRLGRVAAPGWPAAMA